MSMFPIKPVGGVFSQRWCKMLAVTFWFAFHEYFVAGLLHNMERKSLVPRNQPFSIAVFGNSTVYFQVTMALNNEV